MKDLPVLRHRSQQKLGSFCYPSSPRTVGKVVEQPRAVWNSKSADGRSEGEMEEGEIMRLNVTKPNQVPCELSCQGREHFGTPQEYPPQRLTVSAGDRGVPP